MYKILGRFADAGTGRGGGAEEGIVEWVSRGEGGTEFRSGAIVGLCLVVFGCVWSCVSVCWGSRSGVRIVFEVQN